MPLRMRSNVASLVAALACAWVSSPETASAAEPTKDQCIDANEGAQTLRKNERLREAEQRLLVCVAASCPGVVRDDCAQRLTEVRAATPTIVFIVKDDADQDLSDVRVTMDGQVLAEKLDGTAIAIDPGQHRFVFESAGRNPEEKALVIREGEKDRHERIILTAAGAAAAAPVPDATVEGGPAATPTSPGKSQRVAGVVVGGVGVAGIALGSVFGIVAKSTYNGAVATCRNGVLTDCTQPGVDQNKSAHDQATISTVAFIAGGALLGAGVLVFFTAPKAAVTVSPSVGLGTAGLDVRGAW
jgi:hypothetical protein